MAKKISVEVIHLRDNMKCAHCGCIFKATDSQAIHYKYEGTAAYCSKICRRAAACQKGIAQAVRAGKQQRKGVLRAPCPTCGQRFESHTDKTFCSLKCYNASPQFKAMLENSREKALSQESIDKRAACARRGSDVRCLECDTVFYQKRSTKNRTAKKFCSRVCYRAYLAKRFDRWIANPQNIASVQCYDEFMASPELVCLVDGCDWSGAHLSIHLNTVHGITASDFKRAAGFNLSTGLVSPSLFEQLSARRHRGVAADAELRAKGIVQTRSGYIITYRSREGVEHKLKARLLKLLASPPTERVCRGCGVTFTQSTPFGRTVYCSVACRSAFYKRTAKSRTSP